MDYQTGGRGCFNCESALFVYFDWLAGWLAGWLATCFIKPYRYMHGVESSVRWIYLQRIDTLLIYVDLSS